MVVEGPIQINIIPIPIQVLKELKSKAFFMAPRVKRLANVNI